jgi:hypothetical protein
MSTIFFSIGLIVLILAVDLLTGWFSPILGPAVMVSAVIALGYFMLKQAAK